MCFEAGLGESTAPCGRMDDRTRGLRSASPTPRERLAGPSTHMQGAVVRSHTRTGMQRSEVKPQTFTSSRQLMRGSSASETTGTCMKSEIFVP